jgi:hypothetical protein
MTAHMEFVMRSRFNLYLAGCLALEALVVRGGAPRLPEPERLGTLVLAAALQRQITAGNRSRGVPRSLVWHLGHGNTSPAMPS